MIRRIYRKKTSSAGFFRLLAGTALIAGICWLGYKLVSEKATLGFSPKALVENSIFKNETFSTNVEEIVSREGIKAYYFEDHTNPIISLSFMFKNAGTAFDDDGEEGIANMAAALLTEGAGNMKAQELKEELEDKAITIYYTADNDDFSGGMKTLKNNLREAGDLLRLTLADPRFDRADIKRIREQMLTAINQQVEYPESTLDILWAQELYGSHPYGRNPVGKKADIKEIDKEKLQKFVKNRFSKSNLIVGIAGDISKTDAEKFLDKVFGGLPDNGSRAFVKDADVVFDGREKNISMPLPQSIAVFAAQGTPRSGDDFYPLYIANQIFGGSGLTSRLAKSAREDRALTYGVYSYLSLGDKSQLLKGRFSSTPENFQKVKAIVDEEWQKIAEKGVTPAELEETKNYMIASYNLRFASLDQISAILVMMQKDGLGKDFLQKRNGYVEAVTLDEVNAAAAKYFGAGKPVWVNIGTMKNN